MPRTLSTAAQTAANALDTPDVFLVLLTLSGSNVVDPIRIVNNTDDVVSRGNTFVAFPFDIVMPEEDGERIGQARIRIDNVSGEILSFLRSLSTAPHVLIEVIRAAAPNEVIYSPRGLKLRDVQISAASIEGVLVADNVGAMRYPADTFDPAAFPGLHR